MTTNTNMPELPSFLKRAKAADQAIKAESKKAKPLTKGKVTKIAVGKKVRAVEAKAKPEASPKPRAKASTPKGELRGKGLKIWNLISRKGGATQAELKKATGWGQVSQSPLKPICKKMGAKLSFEGRGDERVYQVR